MQFVWPTYCDNISRSVPSMSGNIEGRPIIPRMLALFWPRVCRQATRPKKSASCIRAECEGRPRFPDIDEDTPLWEIIRNGTVHTAVETTFVDCGKIPCTGIHRIHKLLWITQNYVKEWYLHNFFHIMWISPWINRPDSSTDTLKTLYLLGFRMVKKGKTVYCQTCQTIL